ncbi:MAG TPA: ATP-dependent Clp protease adaptor ClpS [Oscillatoriaceae cyanobacterium M7585_C2015_266]|nr:ATP-dependent Clp protease adaptor ClpS [Oscillatoriaceae cyanobacterium M7585_C2015_266]
MERKRFSNQELNASYSVILLNDNFNTFDYVSHCLKKYIPNMTSEQAWQLTHKVHSEGKAVVWCGCQELAALYRMQLSGAGLTVAFLEKEYSPCHVT